MYECVNMCVCVNFYLHVYAYVNVHIFVYIYEYVYVHMRESFLFHRAAARNSLYTPHIYRQNTYIWREDKDT